MPTAAELRDRVTCSLRECTGIGCLSPGGCAAPSVERLVDERRRVYGHPLTNHRRIADFWTVRLRDKLRDGAVIEPHEAAACMRLVKEARLMQTRGHADSLDDLEGYADVEREIHAAQEGQ